MLMSAGLSLPKMVFGHGFLTKVLRPNIEFMVSCENVAVNISASRAAHPKEKELFELESQAANSCNVESFSQ